MVEASYLLEKSNEMLQKAFINEFASYCAGVNIDVYKVIDVCDKMKRRQYLETPCIGVLSKYFDTTSQNWPIYSVMRESLVNKPKEVFEYIKQKYNGLHDKNVLVVGVGNTMGSSNYIDSPAMLVVSMLEKDGANVTIFDLFIEQWDALPSTTDVFDIIIVFQPYMVSRWLSLSNSEFFCRKY